MCTAPYALTMAGSTSLSQPTSRTSTPRMMPATANPRDPAAARLPRKWPDKQMRDAGADYGAYGTRHARREARREFDHRSKGQYARDCRSDEDDDSLPDDAHSAAVAGAYFSKLNLHRGDDSSLVVGQGHGLTYPGLESGSDAGLAWHLAHDRDTTLFLHS
jgi:hypothetical protein